MFLKKDDVKDTDRGTRVETNLSMTHCSSLGILLSLCAQFSSYGIKDETEKTCSFPCLLKHLWGMNVHVFLECFPLGFTTYSFSGNISQCFFFFEITIELVNTIISLMPVREIKGKRFLYWENWISHSSDKHNGLLPTNNRSGVISARMFGLPQQGHSPVGEH